ncbi:hypothetical protein [Salinicoccus luteus]|uniref:hypothetical protein n=1 Tax=Salinicoccus luteus TaxID=367840 RepID=UPI0004E0FEAF|nr:hypothetical protein [Salinicoccus luteus]
MNLSHTLSKAFLIAPHEITIDGFEYLPLDKERHLLISNDYSYTKKDIGRSSIILLGYAYDIRNAATTTEQILETVLISGDEERYSHLDFLNGRYVLIINTPEGLFLYSDATSLKPVFYSRKLRCVSSHEYILRQLLKQTGEKIEQTSLFRKGFMDLTNTEGIYKLSPSVEFEFDSFSSKRIFPRKERIEMKIDDILKEMNGYIEESRKWLLTRENLKFSLTGGVDSRVSLALLRPLVHRMKFFTYLKPDEELSTKTLDRAYKNDEAIVRSMVYNLNLDHEFFYIRLNQADQEYYDMMKETVSSLHSYPLSRYLNDNDAYHGGLHIKSTVQSIGKSSFDRKLYNENTVVNALEGIRKWAPKPYKKEENKEELGKWLSNFLQRIGMEETYGYHLLDLMFLESRLGNFQSNITQETDNTLEVFNLFNSRRMIELFLSPSLTERQNQSLAFAIIDEYWPVLNFFGINTQETLLEKYEALKSRQKETPQAIQKEKTDLNDVDIQFSKNIAQHTDEYGLMLVPKELPLTPGLDYRIKVHNTTEQELKVTFSTKYDKEQGRGRVELLFEDASKDIVDLAGGYDVILPPYGHATVQYDFKSEMNKPSWQKASRLYLNIGMV